MQKRILLPLLTLLALGANAASAQSSSRPLQGQIKRNQARLARPGATRRPMVDVINSNKLDAKLETSSFDVNAIKNSMPENQSQTQTPISLQQIQFPQTEKTAVQPTKLDATVHEERPTSPPPSDNNTSGGGGGGGGGGASLAQDNSSIFPSKPKKKIFIHVKKFRAGNEMEIVWEAARMANALAKKGGDVTVWLDMEATHAANKSDTNFAEFEPNRGSGNTSAPKLTSPQQILHEFVNNGGHLVVSERWAKLFGMVGGYGSALIPGTQVLQDDEIAELLLESDTSIDY